MLPAALGASVGLATAAYAGRAAAADPDPWLGPDKALHFGVSVALGGGGYALSALFLERPWQRALAGSGFSLTLGAGKELYDLSGHGDASWKDFTWDVAGTAVGVGIALLVDAIASGEKRDRPKPAPPSGRTMQMAFSF
jgi:putative lipoprotein